MSDGSPGPEVFGVCRELADAGVAQVVRDYSGPNAIYYDLVQFFDDDVPFYVERALARGGRVLELGCGTGRVLLPLARAGLEVTGVDASEDMLGVCRAKLAAEPPEVAQRVHLVCGDMRSVSLEGRFGLALIPLYTLNHLLTEEDKLSAFALCVRHLAAGGRLIIDAELDTPLDASRGMQLTVHRVDPAAGRALLGFSQSRRLDDGSVLLNMLYAVAQSGGRARLWVTASRESRTTPNELRGQLAATGLQIRSMAADYRGTPLSSSARCAVVEAEKPGGR